MKQNQRTIRLTKLGETKNQSNQVKQRGKKQTKVKLATLKGKLIKKIHHRDTAI